MTGGRIRRGFHQAAWHEPLIMELSRADRRGILVPDGSGTFDHVDPAPIPGLLDRRSAPRLPEVSQQDVVRHYTRLSQMVLGNSVSNNIGLGTTTMKYSPVINEVLSRITADIHPAQPESTLQGVLEVMGRLGEALEAISGMSQFSLQAGGGAAAIFANASIIKAYHASHGDTHRDEIITTIFSHPANAATAATCGFKVITLYPGPDGVATLESLQAALSDRTAGLMMTNPEDTGLFNPAVEDFVKAVHERGGLCSYDQANANSILGISRARDVGFDLCHFNLHKTFSVPHGSVGGAVGAVGVRAGLERFLPGPFVVRSDDGQSYRLGWDERASIGKVRSWLGNVHSLVKAYSWIRAIGLDHMKEVAETAVLNNNYLDSMIRAVPGVGVYAPQNPSLRLGEARYSWADLADETGIGTDAIHDRMIDFGLQGYFTSHHPWLLPEPFTLEPTDSATVEDLEEFATVMAEIANEARTAPDVFAQAPHRAASDGAVRPLRGMPVTTWAAYLRERGKEGSPSETG